MNMQVKTKKITSTAIISMFIISMISVFATVPLARATGTPVDLTPDYAKAGATIDILSFNIVGPTGGTTLTSVIVDYTGTVFSDVAYTAIYVSTDGGVTWTVFGWSGFFPTDPQTITGSYSIGASVTATVKLTITLKSTAVEGDTVDAKINDYATTAPPAEGTDIPPIDPDGYTIIDNTAPTVTLTAPIDGAYITANTYTVTATATDSVVSVSFYYKLVSGDWVLIGTDNTSPYEFNWDLTEIEDQTGIQVKAVAVDNAGNEAEDINTNITLDREPPTAPTDLTATAESGAIVLSWTTSTDETSGVKLYNIYRGTASGGPYTFIGTVDHPTTTYTDTTVGPVAGITYYYVVIAVDFAGWESDPSDEASATTVPGEVFSVEVTAVPTTVAADGVASSKITATVKDKWNNPIPEVNVYFTTTLGTLSASSAVTNDKGEATVTLTSTLMGTATVTATADSISDDVDVEFTGVGGIGDILLKLLGIKKILSLHAFIHKKDG